MHLALKEDMQKAEFKDDTTTILIVIEAVWNRYKDLVGQRVNVLTTM
jgi:hypothetical protein